MSSAARITPKTTVGVGVDGLSATAQVCDGIDDRTDDLALYLVAFGGADPVTDRAQFLHDDQVAIERVLTSHG